MKALMAQLERDGWNPKLCDTRVPFYDTSVPCGEPTMVFDDDSDSIVLPKEMLSMMPEFTITVKGDSMKDAGICQGDVLEVVCDRNVHDGEIVLAVIDGESTIKTYCEDDEGRPWLLPCNSRYKPISLDDKYNVNIIGRITKIIKEAPRMSFRECMKLIRSAKQENPENREITQLQISKTIREMASQITIARQWYAVYRAMVDKNIVRENDFEAFCEMIRIEVPQHQHLPVCDELQRLASLSFTKPVRLWNASNAPVQGKRFNDYLKLASRTIELLEARG